MPYILKCKVSLIFIRNFTFHLKIQRYYFVVFRGERGDKECMTHTALLPQSFSSE